jgi:hypothetical protein
VAPQQKELRKMLKENKDGILEGRDPGSKGIRNKLLIGFESRPIHTSANAIISHPF